MNNITHPAEYLTPEAAAALAKRLTSEAEDGWTYRAVPMVDGSRWSKVLVFDETGAEMGAL